MTLARTTDPSTSHKAAEGKRDVRAEILAAFHRRPVKGWTDFELEPVIVDATGVSPQRVRTVRAELTRPTSGVLPGRFSATWTWSAAPLAAVEGATRATPRGHRAQVFRLA
jgi:hypothetical protein